MIWLTTLVNRFTYRSLILTLCLFGFTAGAGATTVTPSPSGGGANLIRLDPDLRRLVESPVARGVSRLSVWQDKASTRRVTALLAVRPDADLSALEGMNVRVNSQGASVVSADVPVSELGRLSGWNGLRYAEAVPRSRPLLDRSVKEIRADVARQFYGRTGKGVLVGLVDSGIDFLHPDFRTPDGHTRIRYLWDQTASSGPSPKDFPYGREYTQDQINAAIDGQTSLSETDDDPEAPGHGTHVAGIAAGGGGGTNLIGVAPDAELIVVKWDGTHGLDANRYLMRLAQDLGLPVVVNNSWGDHKGPHDGTDADTLGLSDLVGTGKPGRALCFAAGNSGDKTIHLGGSLNPDESGEVHLLAGSGQTNLTVEVWADASARYRFGFKFSTGPGSATPTEFTVLTGENGTLEVPSDDTTPYGGAVISLDARDNPYPMNPSLQRCTLSFDLSNTQWGYLTDQLWSLTIQRIGDAGDGHLDGWITDGDRFSFAPSGTRLHGDTAKTLVDQACAKNGIAVGAYVSKTQWTAINGMQVDGPDGPLDSVPGDPSSFSSEGPTRDGQQKPELSAPGQWVASTLSEDINVPFTAQDYVTPDGKHILSRGTSMASPHVAGTIALMLEANPKLDAAQIREFLIGGLPSPFQWTPKEGFGKLDAYEALRRAVLSGERLPGDLNGDGHVDIKDVTRALQIALGIVAPLPQEIALADLAPPVSDTHPTPGDGRLSLGDVTLLLQRSISFQVAARPSAP